MLGVSVRLSQTLEYVIIETNSISPRCSMMVPIEDVDALAQLLTEAAESARQMAEYDRCEARTRRKAARAAA
jgi:hypothetical protein